MKKLPLLSLARVTKTERIKGSPRHFTISVPAPKRQKQRLGPKFLKLKQTLEQQPGTLAISDNTQSIVPERTLVFELAQSRQNFRKQAEKIGLAWVGEEEFFFEPDDDFHDNKSVIKTDAKVKLIEGRMYLTSPNQKSLHDLLRLWDLYQNEKLPEAEKAWAEFFSNLRDIRPWGPRDRLPPSTISFLDEVRANNPQTLKLEIEAVFYGSVDKNVAAHKNLRNALKRENVDILDIVTIEEIRYHGLLVELQISEIDALLKFDSTLLSFNEINFIRPQSLCQSLTVDDPYSGESKYTPDNPEQLSPPIAALFDGVPVENHDLLKGRLVISDPQNLASTAPVYTRCHGTAMASLILHGDLAEKPQALSRKIYVNCLLGGSDSSNKEVTKGDRLLLGLIYEAVKTIAQVKSAETNEEIFIVNLSLGDANRPFVGAMSAWAKLIDYLAWHYRILFLISAGNIAQPLSLSGISSPAALSALSKHSKREAFIRALEEKAAFRTLFSPAESINALTIGACHSDGIAPVKNNYLIDPFDSHHFPSIISGMGLGYRRAVKPDILHSGGKSLCTYALTGGALQLKTGQAGKYFGQQVAHATNTSATTRIIGTSNSTALVTRGAIQIYEALREYTQGAPEISAFLARKYVPCVVKTLLVHSATWGDGGKFLESTLKPQGGHHWKSRRTNVTRFLGFGRVNFDRVVSCAPNRATLLGVGEVAADDADIFEFPLPPSLSGGKEIRRLIVTLGWISPIRISDQNYRTATLDLVPEKKNGYPIGVERLSAQQPPSDLSRKGTVVHEIFEGKDAVPIGDKDTLRLRVECRKLGNMATPKIPYALAVTFEVAETSKVNVYQEISAKVSVKTGTRVRV